VSNRFNNKLSRCQSTSLQLDTSGESWSTPLDGHDMMKYRISRPFYVGLFID